MYSSLHVSFANFLHAVYFQPPQDLASVAEFAASYTHATLDLLVCNAGIMNTPFALSKVSDDC
jgi:NAD(P)-dependent dehydrogenase (short-subunit alcohol dehydrogenase family)